MIRLLTILLLHCLTARADDVELACDLYTNAASAVLISWGNAPGQYLHHQSFSTPATDFTVTNVDATQPLYFTAAFVYLAPQVITIKAGTNTIVISNSVTDGPAASPISLFVEHMKPGAWMNAGEITVCGWGEQGMAYKLMAGATVNLCSNEVAFITGTNGPWFFTEPATNAAQFFQTIVMPEPAG